MQLFLCILEDSVSFFLEGGYLELVLTIGTFLGTHSRTHKSFFQFPQVQAPLYEVCGSYFLMAQELFLC